MGQYSFSENKLPVHKRPSLCPEAPRVVFTTPTLTHYRVEFHERARQLFASRHIEYKLVYGLPGKDEEMKGDCADVPWGTKVHNHYGRWGFARTLWQPYLRGLCTGDLVILPQENRVLSNYMVQTIRSAWPVQVALWGHGRNFQSTNPDGFMERWKKWWALRCDWWFTYTDQTAALIANYGFPEERITVIQNSIDTSELRRLAAGIDNEELASLRYRWSIETENVGVYVGGLYREKRIDFLIESAIAIRRSVPDFILAIVGSGPDRGLVEQAAAQHSWIRYFGSKFGREKVEIMKLSKVFLMPGLVGLAVLDCLALGLPLVTTAYPFHSPEVAYMQDGISGFIVRDWQNSSSYAQQVVGMLKNSALRARLVEGALKSGQRYTIENMAERFVGGALRALKID